MSEDELTQDEQQYFDNRGEVEESEAPAEEAAEETAEGTAGETTEETPEVEEPEVPQTVSREQYDQIHKAMDAERHKARELAQQYDEYRRANEEKFARLDERLKVLNQQFGLDQEEETEPAIQTTKVLQEQQEAITRQSQQLEAMQKAAILNSQEQQFASSTPDYNDAKNFFFQKRVEALSALGYGQDVIQNQIQREIADIGNMALSGGGNIAQTVYEAAKKMGFENIQKSKAKLKTIETAQTQSKTLPKGAPPKGELTLESLDSMSDDEFANLSYDDFKKVMGG